MKGLSQLPNKAIAPHVHQGRLVMLTLLFLAKLDTPASTESSPYVQSVAIPHQGNPPAVYVMLVSILPLEDLFLVFLVLMDMYVRMES